MKPTQEMIDRFLGWKLPADFAPDAGVSFDREYAAKWGMPTGTNLFTANQARAMFEYALAGSEAPPQRQPLTAEELWASNEVMALNADLGLGIADWVRIARAIAAAKEQS